MTASRRDFLKVTLAAGGAFAIGIALPGCHGYDAKTAEKADRTGEFSPNAWLRIFPDDRVVFVLDRVEMGQGTMTSHTTMLAEELEVDPRKIHVDLAPSDRAYAQPDIGFQITGGSSSVKGAWEPLRRAGATAREMLRAAAAASWGASLAECRCEDGAVIGPGGKRATYGSLTRAAAHMPVPTPELKPPSAYKWIGKSMPRLDGRMKVDGSGVYGIDVKVPEMLTAVVVRCPVVAGGKLAGFEGAKAKASPGVVDVFAVPSGVAVVATSFWRAKKAAELVEARWDEGPLASLDTAGMRAMYAARAKEPAKPVRDDGDFERAAKDGKLVEGVYEVPYLAHATMEPQNCTVHVRDDHCEIWAPTQSPAMAEEMARKILGLSSKAVTVHQTLVGGGFGRRLGDDFVSEAVHVGQRVKRPVKVVWTREDDTRHDFYRPATYNVLRATIQGGKVAGWFHRIVSQSILAQVVDTWAPLIAGGAPQALKPFLGRTAAHLYRSNVAPDSTATESAGDFAYAIPNLRVEHAQIDSAVPVGFWRSVGHSENAFIVESFVDECAHAAGRDPLDVRRELLAKSPRHLGVLERVAKEAGWGRPLAPGLSRGIAQCKSFDTFCAQVAEVSVEGGRIRVHRVVAAIDCGVVVNPDLVRAQVESAVVFGLSAALHQRITLTRGRVDQSNFHDYPMMRMFETPKVEVHIVDSHEKPTGVGEPGLPPVAPAVANAVFAATGKRLRALPLSLA